MRLRVNRFLEEYTGECGVKGVFASSTKVGGVNIACENGLGYMYDLPIDKVIEIAKKYGKDITLSGPEWLSFNLVSGGELPVDQFEALISEEK